MCISFVIGIIAIDCYGVGCCYCLVLPPSVHTVKSAASKKNLEWLLQHEHEHRQWSAAISLGLISSCLHVTDHKERYHNITGLLEVLFVSKSYLVKGACWTGVFVPISSYQS